MATASREPLSVLESGPVACVSGPVCRRTPRTAFTQTVAVGSNPRRPLARDAECIHKGGLTASRRAPRSSQSDPTVRALTSMVPRNAADGLDEDAGHLRKAGGPPQRERSPLQPDVRADATTSRASLELGATHESLDVAVLTLALYRGRCAVHGADECSVNRAGDRWSGGGLRGLGASRCVRARWRA
jgi:hypothetical protein